MQPNDPPNAPTPAREGLPVLPVLLLVLFAALLSGALLPPLPSGSPAPGVSAATAQEPDPHLTRKEKRELIRLLRESKTELDELVADVDGDAWSRRPGEDRWSVGEVVEHLLLAERLLSQRIDSLLASDPDPEWTETETLQVHQVIERISDRSRKFNAPQPIQPTGEMDRTTLLREFAAAREATIDKLRDVDGPIKRHTSPNPLFGKINTSQWFAFVAGHNFRHNQQIAEVKAELR